MDSTTVIFIVTIVVAFIFLRWLITPIPQDSDFPNISSGNTGTVAAGSSASGRATSRGSMSVTRRNGRQVNDSMVEVVQTIAPNLTVEQIRFDLENTGSVEVTIDRYMELGTLPFPPGYVPPTPAPEPSSNAEGEEKKKSKEAEKESINLFKKYNIDVNNPILDSDDIVKNRRNEMIFNARKRMAASLQKQNNPN
ncbi:CUE1 [Candida oxycetoniae]|uniref:Coupling of ubiquitin conjugation to ER degradation protein 1 n=1 Tax=Candida oxycetoniae TaxID=497107 RepID=A0AAI9WWL7_9ASCO|nr:CUE1 [Candida oxycetoniae]KAI3403307.2 CUE1 [Candida oxycetoniae]